MLISKIKRQSKNSKRVSIFIDDEFKCGLYEDTVVKYNLSTGDEISEETLDAIINFDEYLYAKKASFDLLSYRLRSEKEIKDKLKLKKISLRTIEKTIKHLKELSLLNDEEFAKQLVLENISSKPKGKNLIRQKLFQKGISKRISEQVLEDVFKSIDEKKIISELFEKYSKKVGSADIYEKKRKIFSYLARKGFDFEIINEVIQEKLT